MPPPTLAAHLSLKSALVLLPPPAVRAPIEAVRRIHDKNFARRPPHVNLLYPFLNLPSVQGLHRPRLKEETYAPVMKVTRQFEPFHVRLLTEETKSLRHRKDRTVWLQPSSFDLFSTLQAALQAEFAECDHDQRRFVPHLPIGQAKTDGQEAQIRELLNKTVPKHTPDNETNGLPWLIDRVYVIERKGFHDRFKPIATIDLGKN